MKGFLSKLCAIEVFTTFNKVWWISMTFKSDPSKINECGLKSYQTGMLFQERLFTASIRIKLKLFLSVNNIVSKYSFGSILD